MVHCHLALFTLLAVAVSIVPAAAQAARALDLDAVSKSVPSNGLSFPVADAGSGPPVLLLHGFPDDRHLWRYQVRALADAGFRVIAPDLRGFGDAPRPQDPKEYGIPTAVKDIIGILDSLGVPRVQLVAHDWGAAVGWRLAAEYPDRIDRYVAMSVGAPGARTSIEQRERSWYMAFFRQTGTAEAQLMQNNWELFREWSRNAVDIDRWIANLSRPGALTAALNWYRAAGNAPREPERRPSAAGPMPGPRHLERWRPLPDRVPAAFLGRADQREFRYERVEGASHWMMVERPDEVNRLLIGFLKK